MSFSTSEIKKYCSEHGYKFHANGIFGVSRNDSGKFDFSVETESVYYAVKAFAVPSDARHIDFIGKNGQYITVYGDKTQTDFMWLRPDFGDAPVGKRKVEMLLVDADVSMTELYKNGVTTVTPGALAFGCTVHTLTSFMKLLGKQ